jgi:hypothetical protein
MTSRSIIGYFRLLSLSPGLDFAWAPGAQVMRHRDFAPLDLRRVLPALRSRGGAFPDASRRQKALSRWKHARTSKITVLSFCSLRVIDPNHSLAAMHPWWRIQIGISRDDNIVVISDWQYDCQDA